MIVFASIYFLLTSAVLPVIIFPICLYYFKKGLWSSERIGIINCDGAFYSNKISPIWIHAASVGEVNVILPVIDDLIENTKHKILVSTMTKTGKLYLKEKTKSIPEDRLQHLFLPIDFWFFCWVFIKKVCPIKLIIAETEIWPSLYLVCHFCNLPITIINGRISDKSFLSYKKGSLFWRSIFKKIHFVATQSELDQKRFNELGVDVSKTMIAGNLKNDGLLKVLKNPPDQIEFAVNKKVIVFGSVRPKEAQFMLEVIKELSQEFQDLSFIICPRHFDWMDNLLILLKEFLFEEPLISSKCSEADMKSANRILIIDEIGYLLSAYRGAKLAYVGGTFVPEYGGHNALEPASFGIPVFIGPYYEEQKVNTNALLAFKGAIIVKSTEEMIAETKKLLLSDSLWKVASEAGIKTVLQEANALEKIKIAGILNEI